MSERARRCDFEEKVLPHLEVLLQFSLYLTRNGRDATRLLRESMTEVYRSWNETMPKEGCKIRLHKVLTRRFYDCFQRHSLPLTCMSGDAFDESLVRKDRLSDVTTINPGQQSSLAGEYDEDVNYFRAIAGLPTMFRPAMILSYIDGFTNREIGDLAGAEPQAVESFLKRGRLLLQDGLFAHLMGEDGLDAVVDREAASG